MAITNILDLARRSEDFGELVARHPEIFGPTFAKLPEDEDRGIVAKFFGIPIGFQFGTAAGFTGVPALVLDIITDPITYLGGFGALTKVARGGRALQKLGPLGRKLGLAIDATGKMDSGQAAKVIEKAVVGVGGRMDTRQLRNMLPALRSSKTAAEAEQKLLGLQKLFASERGRALKKIGESRVTRDLQYDRALDALRRGGIEGAERQIRSELAKRRLIATKASKLRDAAANPRQFDRIVRDILKLDPSASTHQLLGGRMRADLRDLIRVSRGTEQISPLARDPLAGRNLFTFRVPFTNIEKPLVTGASFMGKVRDVAAKATPEALKARRATPGLVKGVREARERSIKVLGDIRSTTSAQTVYETGVRAAQSIGAIPMHVAKFQNLMHTWSAETNSSRMMSSVFGLEVKQHLRGIGMDNEKGWGLLRELIEGKHVAREAVPRAARRGRWGPTHIVGEVTEEGKRAGVTDELKELAESVNAVLRDARGTLADNDAVESFIRFYFPRRISIIKDSKRFEQRMKDAFSPKVIDTFYRHAQRRRAMGPEGYEQLLRMEKDGIIELEKDPAKILSAYFEEAGRAVANKRLVNRIWSVREDIPVPQGMIKMPEGHGLPVIMRTSPEKVGKYKRFASLYVRSDDPALINAVQRVSGKRTPGWGGEVYVLREWATPMRKVIGETVAPKELGGVREAAFRSAETVNALAKRSLLFWTAFHHMALTESAIADMGWTFLRRAPKLVKQIAAGTTAALKGGGLGAVDEATDQLLRRTFHEADDIVEESVKHGLQLGAILDPMVDVFQSTMKRVSGLAKPVSPAIDAVARGTMIHDKKLWDYYHNSLKLMAYNEIATRGYLKYPNMPKRLVREAAAEHVNNAFGGQVWERFWVGKMGQRWARLALLSPDWTSSQLKIAQDVYANWFKKNDLGRRLISLNGRFPVSAEDVLKSDVRATFSRQYALRAGMIFVVAANMANFAFTGHFMDDNPEGHKSMIMLPVKDESGRGQFIRFGKQFREPFDWMHEPIWTLRKKLGPSPSIAITQLTGRDIFGRPIVTTKDGPVHNLAKRVGSVLGGAAPIPVQELAARFAPEEAGMFGVRRAQRRAPFAAVLGTMGLPVRTEFRQGKAEKVVASQEPSIPDLYHELVQDRMYRNPLDNLLKQQAVMPPTALLPVAR